MAWLAFIVAVFYGGGSQPNSTVLETQAVRP